MEGRVNYFGWSILLLAIVYCTQGNSESTEPTTPSAIERKTCGNASQYYCHNGCCLDENKVEGCCYLFQTSEWCPIVNGSEIYCRWGCCYHEEDEICCTFLTMQYSFLIILAAILVSFLVFVLIVSCISNCLSCSCTEPSYRRAF